MEDFYVEIIFACLSAIQWFLCFPSCCVSLSLHFLALLSSGPSSHLDPAGGRSSRVLQEKSSELHERFWLKFGEKHPFLLFISSQQMSFFLILLTSYWMFLHSLILFPSLELPILSLLPFSWSRSQSLNHFFFSFLHSFIHSFCPLIHSLSFFLQLWLPWFILLIIFLPISSSPCP